MDLYDLKSDAGLDFKRPVTTATKAGKSTSPKIMDFRSSPGLTSGLKRVGGRGGISRLGRKTRENIGEARHGRPIVSHRY